MSVTEGPQPTVVPSTDAISAIQPEAVRTRHRRGVPRVVPWWIRTHRWVAIVLGVVILIECVSGSVLLMRPELDRWTHPGRYHSTATTHPMTGAQAIDLVNRLHPKEGATDVGGANGVWQVDGYYIDPGTGKVNDHDGGGGVYNWVMNLMTQSHDCFFACQGSPLYLGVMTDGVPGTDFTVGQWFLGLSALGLFFLSLSGLIAWWPALRKWGTVFRVRTRRGSYARDLDLHKLIGILAMPLLLMWGFTGMTYAGWQWPSKVYDTITRNHHPAPEPVTVGTGPVITAAQAESEALAAVPGGHTIAIRAYDPASKGGTYLINVSVHEDYHRHAYDWGATRYVSVDAHGGGVTGAKLTDQGARSKFFNYLNLMHTGVTWHWIPRLLFQVTSGLAVVPLALTGITVWLTRWRSRRGRRRRRRADAQVAAGV